MEKQKNKRLNDQLEISESNFQQIFDTLQKVSELFMHILYLYLIEFFRHSIDDSLVLVFEYIFQIRKVNIATK